uniref:neuronal tyrosine-phosphorylated phosphoinositide-3-kinase adapter 1-like isoform X5 n=1 Tax=Pristiophorus japonicus TaxID=55135 RepID=UPI00398E795F
MMSGGLQDAAITSFLQYIEEKGLKAYNSLTKHSCDTGKASRCLRDEMNLLYRKTKMEWKHREEESKKSICKDGGLGRVRELASFRKHFRMGFMTMPASQDHGPHPCAGGMTTRSLSLHSVGSVENGEISCARKPPDKPRRHPSTKLSLCGEGAGAKGEKVGQRTSLEGGDGGRRIPPLKPKRSPNTQLSVSFDEASVGRACGGGLGARFGPPTPHRRGSQEEAEEEEEEEEEPVYIEMVGDAFREQGLPEEDSDHSEAIYEEMKYPLLEEGPSRELRWSKLALARPRLPGACKAGARVPPYDIPPPFPNLLLHRPPLLAFPQAPSHKAYKGPPASRLPVLQHGEPPKEEDPANPPGGLAPAGRARSHSTPLPPQASGQHRPEKELPTSQTMAGPGLHPGPQHPAHPKAERDRPPSSVGLACASAKQAAHPPGEPRPDKEPPGLPGLFCSVAKVTRPQSGLFKATAAGRAPPEHPGLPGTLAGAWPYCAPPACKRPPAYDSLKPGVGPKACPSAPQHSTVRTQAPAFASICCSRAIANSEARTAGGPAGEGGSGRNWQRKLSCGRKAKDPEGGARGWSGGGESLAKEERTSGPPLKAEDPEGASLKGPTRSGLPQPCPMVCQRNEDPTLGHRLGRSASTSGVRQPLAHLQRQSSQSRDSPSQSLHHPQPQGQQGSREKDGKLLEVIERKRCLCKEIKARRRPERSLCKQDSMPILPSWRKAADTRKTGTPPCQRQHTVLWDTAI